MQRQTAVQVEDLHKSYGKEEVLKGVSLQASCGDVVAIIGASGSGKSTLLRCINFLELPSRGRILIAGEAIKTVSKADGNLHPNDQRQLERLRTKLGMVFQGFNLWPHFTVLQNVIEAPIQVLKKPKAEAVEQAELLLKKVGLYDKRHDYPMLLSGGQQQRAAIARALAMSPDVMLFDEPTSALDPELVGEVLKVIRNLAEEGRTMLMVTHELKFAREVANRIIYLHAGLIEEEGLPSDVFDHPQSKRCQQFIARAFPGAMI